MRKYFLLSILELVFAFANAQNPVYPYSEGHKMDSLRIDSLKKILPSLKGTAEIDCLNQLCENYNHILSTPGFLFNHDSAHFYNAKAYQRAKKINYKKGIAISLLLKLAPLPDSLREKNIEEALKIGKEINDSYVLGSAYYFLGVFIIKNNKDFSKHIECFTKAIEYFQKTGDVINEAQVTTRLSGEFIEKGDYGNAFIYWTRSVELAKLLKHIPSDRSYYHIQYSFINGSELYKKVGDYRTSLDYLLQANRFAKEQRLEWGAESRLIELYTLMGKYDSSLHYLNLYKTKFPDAISAYNMWLGEIYLSSGEYRKAIPLFAKSIEITRKNNYTPLYYGHLAKNMIGLAEAYILAKQYQNAYDVAQEGLMLAKKTNWREYLTKGFGVLSEIYINLNKPDSAYHFLKNYMTLKDSTQNIHFLWRLNEQLNNYKKAIEDQKRISQLELLNKDNQLKAQKLKQEAFVKKALIAGLILLLLFGVFVFRYLSLKRKNELQKQKLESEKRQAELQQKATELEMQALRAQMNPHFIFNCLSSINKFILQNNTDAASDYLTRFSRLIRFSLNNSQLSLIPLSVEIEMLRLYLDMERLRFSESFDYNINYANTIEPETIYIPPMLLQPFCENAIWHGLMHKNEQGKLELMMSIQDNQLQCIITDNGIG
ncbi:MAG TPA: histidine kinase, partial [Chitinophagaceae bacterium]|nr:histidine kinase [Chitinophagaceae bacterium]